MLLSFIGTVDRYPVHSIKKTVTPVGVVLVEPALQALVLPASTDEGARSLVEELSFPLTGLIGVGLVLLG